MAAELPPLDPAVLPPGVRSRFLDGINGLRMHVLEAGFDHVPSGFPTQEQLAATMARIDEAKTELTRIIQDREMKDALLLVFANKQDLSGGAYIPQSTNEDIALTPHSYATKGSLRPSAIRQDRQRPRMEGRAQLRDNRRGYLRGTGTFESPQSHVSFIN